MPTRAATLSILALLTGFADASAEPTWRRLVTPHFTLVGEVGERQLRDVARRLEEFSDVVGRMLPRARITPPAPATVIVFGSRSSLRPFVPRFDGTTRDDIGGYFLPGRDRYYIGLLHGGGDAAYRVVYHELAHLIVNNTTPDVPAWFNEGLAEFYSTFELSANGRQASIGRVVPEHVHLLRDRFMPLGQLFRVTRESKEYNERDRASVFYAQSWALVHYLLNGRPERTPQMFAFLDRQRQGLPVEAAFAESFDVGVDMLERELRNYVGQQRFVFQHFRLEGTLTGEQYPVEVLPAATVDAVLGGLLARLDRPDEARARLERALLADAHLSEAHASLAWIAWRDGRYGEALEQVTRAIESDPGNGHAHGLYGLVAASDTPSLNDPAVRDTTRRVLTRATEIGPEWPDPWFLLAQVQAVAGERDEARVSIERAMRLAPGRLEYRLVLAQVFAASSDYAAARGVLGPLMAQQDRPDLADAARSLLAVLASRQLAATESPDETAVGAPADPATAAPAGDGLIPVFRKTVAGEERARGRWVDLECRGQTFVVHVELAGEVRRFGAPADAVEFISHRADLQGAVTCGRREPPEEVFVTWRADETWGPDGLPRLVAVEILPEK